MRNIHIATQLHFQCKAFPVNHREDKVAYRHLAVADKNIDSVTATHLSELFRADHVIIR